ncbi:phage tail protein [Emticicia fontis]
MKKFIYNSCFGLFIFLCLSQIAKAQSTTITPGDYYQPEPNITASSTNSGILVPQITLTASLVDPNPVTEPAEGLLVYNIGNNQAKGFYYWTGDNWQYLAPFTTPAASAPISITANTIKLNSGTQAGQLLTWDGNNWVNTNPKPDIVLDNLQPYLALNFCIALQGVFPSRNGQDNYIGEINIFGFNYAPKDWAACDGQILSIYQNTALFSLLGTYYGGNGVSTFALPDLRGKVPMHMGQGPGLSSYVLGQSGGTETITVSNKY